MKIWCFMGANALWALSGDATGSRLPSELGPWIFLKTAELDGADESMLEAEQLVRDHGYCCFDANSKGGS
ncbi:hypothetical protein [Flavisphingomonas formosensis]|uniref:hypothetical protein n=1 Tax=Flavisphingomonas formosensis TaxID=861534 RepID=UPI0012FCEE31|nr:hypothetical protein [Sphingomonas formosensis]